MMSEAALQEQLAANLRLVRQRIAAAAERSGRAPDAVCLIGISKTHPLSYVEAAHAAGLDDFGENRVQEAWAKFAEGAPCGLRLHLVGNLQRNKAKRAVQLFDYFHALDGLPLARSIAKAAVEAGKTPYPVLLEVNVGEEESKFGFAVDEAEAALAELLQMPELAPEGLMTVAPYVTEPEQVRPVFRQLRQLRDELEQRFGVALPQLSMGMSGDYEVAIAEGATLVRVGTAIFGRRV